MQAPSSQREVLARAFAAHQAGNIGQAELLYKLVLADDKKQFDALHMLGIIEGQRGNFAAGLRRLKDALRVRPNATDVLINLGRMQSELGDDSAAAATYERVLAAAPQSPLAHTNFAIVLSRQRRYEEALLHCNAALDIAPNFAEAWNRRANVLLDTKRPAEALESYDRALRLEPNLAEAHLGRGNVFRQLERYDEALAPYQKALAIKPDLSAAWYGCGRIFFELKRYQEAIAAYDKAASLNADYAQSARLTAKLEICNWDNLESECAALVAGVTQKGLKSIPFRMLAVSASAAAQLRCAEIWVADQCPPARKSLWRGEPYRHDRIRIAYLSADMHEHPVAYSTAGLFEQHDRSRFEVTCLSFGPDRDSPMRHRIKGAFERFVDVRHNSDQEIAELIRKLEIDVAVDLMGHTRNSRSQILARRPAPTQVSYLGYLGTMGAKYIDYTIADKIVLPLDQQKYYTENIVHLPHCFLANDSRLTVASDTPSRQDVGLPAEGFVFCSFNDSYKLRRPLFELWMRLLRVVERSVLWLVEANAYMVANLRREAGRCGIEESRLIFAPRVPLSKHLARQRLADLFLDTIPYNAGATGAGALWAGIPILTMIGETFVGRMAASMLHAAGLPELVAKSLLDYEALAVKIATEPAFCASLKDRLMHNREICPLFDTTRFTRNMEAAYTTMWQRHQRGERPRSFAVEPS
ncbi:MAG: tetratricopeptide repeat protein [Xanthobacteraceae bacterium]